MLSGVLQDSILASNPFNIFINDLFSWLTKSDLHSFGDNNAIAVTCNSFNDLLHKLEKESESAEHWFINNNMIANPDKFQAIVVTNRKENQITHKLKNI